MSAREQLVTALQVRTAHADAWEELGRCSLRSGGGWTRLAGIRLMATGLPHPQWNNGDVIDPLAVDIDRVAAWYEERRVPWGVRVPAGGQWPHGERLFEKRLMGMSTRSLQPSAKVDGLEVREAASRDIDAVVYVDATAFEEPAELERPWITLLVAARSVTVAIAERHGEVVATGYIVATEGDAGPALNLAGVAVLPDSRRQGVAATVSAWLLRRGSAHGSHLAHLHPDNDEAARVYARLGFVEVNGFDVYVNNV